MVPSLMCGNLGSRAPRRGNQHRGTIVSKQEKASAYVLTSSALCDSLIQLIQIDLPSLNVRRAFDRFSSTTHELKQRLHEELRVELNVYRATRDHQLRKHAITRTGGKRRCTCDCSMLSC